MRSARAIRSLFHPNASNIATLLRFSWLAICAGRPRPPQLAGTGSPNRSRISTIEKKSASLTPAVLAPGGRRDRIPPTPEPVGPCCHRLRGVMASAQALAIGRVKGRAAIGALDDVIG